MWSGKTVIKYLWVCLCLARLLDVLYFFPQSEHTNSPPIDGEFDLELDRLILPTSARLRTLWSSGLSFVQMMIWLAFSGRTIFIVRVVGGLACLIRTSCILAAKTSSSSLPSSAKLTSASWWRLKRSLLLVVLTSGASSLTLTSKSM